ncbi:MAG TPA: ribosome-associated translation inhibitor RaiA [Trueperaceae bacterium]
MNIYKMTGRNVELTEAMRTYAEDKLEKLSRFSDHIVDVRVVMSTTAGSGANPPAKVEVQVNLPNGMIRAEEGGQDTYSAIDVVVDKLERQLKRYKGRLTARRSGQPGSQDTATATTEPAEEPEEQAPSIVRIKRHVLRPMSAEDAAMQMEDLGHNFFMFRNADTGEINVLYLRQDGNYGLIEPAS